MSKNSIIIGAKVRAARKEAGHTLKTVGEWIGIGIAAMSKKERGQDNFTAEQLAIVARHLGRQIWEFLGEVE
jgi:transcriptional regulator with XRE-family HTH domain